MAVAGSHSGGEETVTGHVRYVSARGGISARRKNEKTWNGTVNESPMIVPKQAHVTKLAAYGAGAYSPVPRIDQTKFGTSVSLHERRTVTLRRQEYKPYIYIGKFKQDRSSTT